MGDIINILQHLNLSPINTVLAAGQLWFVWKLFEKFSKLEGDDGPIRKLEKRLNDHDITRGRIEERVDHLERER